jgi:putative transcriptional regulator
MTARHPSEATLAAYAAGTLADALALVLATHLAQCPDCQGSLSVLEATGGALLEAIAPVPLASDALERVLSRTEEPPPPMPPMLNPDLPAPLNRVALGRWWPIGPGMRYRPLRTRGAVWGGLVLAQPNRSLPRHGHTGLELTCILAGAFADGDGIYRAGDLCEPESDHDIPPTVIGPVPCLCVIASEGMRLRGLLGWLQRMTGQ